VYSDNVRIDDWGSVWRTRDVMVAGEVEQPVLAEWGQFDRYEPPLEMLEQPACEQVNEFCRASSSFVIGGIGAGPFERLQFLRGTENVFLDLAEKHKLLGRLLEMVHDFYVRHCELWCRSDVDAVSIGDDWGSQRALLISPILWRCMLKPLYAQYCQMIRAAGKRVFFHSDGMIREIMEDLVEIGVDALNCETPIMDMAEIGRTFSGRLTFWGAIDPRVIANYASVADVRQAADCIRQALGSPDGGFIAQLEWGGDVPVDNVLAAFEQWSRP